MSKELNQYIGKRVHELRKGLGLNQDNIASVLNISRASIVNIESGRHGMSIENIIMICRLFNCTPNDLFPPIEAFEYTIEEVPVVVKKKNVLKITNTHSNNK
jgi:putative transcriptional regulator